MNNPQFAIISGSIESSINARSLLHILKSRGIKAYIDGSDLVIGGASKLWIQFDKGLNSMCSEGGQLDKVLEQAKAIAEALSQNGTNFFIEVCNDNWDEIITFGNYGRN